jgi:hypothetical protein
MSLLGGHNDSSAARRLVWRKGLLGHRRSLRDGMTEGAQ